MDEIARPFGDISFSMILVIMMILVFFIMILLIVRFTYLLANEGDRAATDNSVICRVIWGPVIVLNDDSATHNGPFASKKVLFQRSLSELHGSVIIGGNVVNSTLVSFMLVCRLSPDVAMDPRIELLVIRGCQALGAQDT